VQRLKAKLDKQKAMAEQDLAHQRLEVTRLQEQLRVRQHPRNTILVQHYVGMSLRGFVHEGGVACLCTSLMSLPVPHFLAVCPAGTAGVIGGPSAPRGGGGVVPCACAGGGAGAASGSIGGHDGG
jgi:hypothetical protein